MNRTYSFNIDYFSIIDTSDKAYFLGLLYADGQNHIAGNYIRLSLNECDEHILNSFIKYINGNNKILKIILENENHSNSSYLQLNSKKMCNDLYNLGCFQNKTNILVFPNEKQLPKMFQKDFIRGYFDGDGSVWEGKRYKAIVKDSKHINGYRNRTIQNVKFNMTGTIDVITNIQNILIDELGFKKVKLNTSKRINNCIQLEYSGRKQMKIFYDYIYYNTNLYLIRKKNKFEECFKIEKDEDSSDR